MKTALLRAGPCAALLLAGAAMAAGMNGGVNRYGGPTYTGQPALGVTAALVRAGGGAKHFSFARALDRMLGSKTVNAEVAKLTRQYGKHRVHEWLQGLNAAVDDGLTIATQDGIKLPKPAMRPGTGLAAALVQAGTAHNGVFWSGLLFDHALSHGIHDKVMDATTAEHGAAFTANYHTITNQAMVDVAHALGHKHVKVAPDH